MAHDTLLLLRAQGLTMTYFLKDSLANCEKDLATGEYVYDPTVGHKDGELCVNGLGLKIAGVMGQTWLLTNAGLPWNCKIIYGFMSDCFPIMGSNRRAYIFLAGLAAGESVI
jgi:hypothetical protein